MPDGNLGAMNKVENKTPYSHRYAILLSVTNNKQMTR